MPLLVQEVLPEKIAVVAKTEGLVDKLTTYKD